MRPFTLSFIACLFALASFGQSPDENILHPDTRVHRSIMILKNENAETASILTADYNSDFSSPFLSRGGGGGCERYKKMKTTGIILASVGGGVLIIGAIMVNVGSADAYNNGFYSTGDWGLVVGGSILVTGGVACAGAGIPLAIIGSVKARKNCGGRATLNLNSGRNGTGLALSF